MKTVCKKLLCLMLVAMMLVSAIPFASATEAAEVGYWYVVHNEEGETLGQFSVILPTGTEITDAMVAEAKANPAIAQFFAEPYELVSTDKQNADAEACRTLFIVKLVEEEEPTEEPTEAPTEAPTEEPAETVIYFNNEKAGKVYTRAFENGEEVEDLPGGVNVKGYDFKGWYSEKGGKGQKLVEGDTWYDGMPDTYYAYYIESVNDGVSTLSVYVRFYVAGVQQGSTQLLYKQDFEDGDNMFQWLSTHETTTANAIFALDGSDGYEWEPRYYYDYSGNEPLTEQDLIADGNKSIVVKVYSKKATEASVFLYVHKNKATAAPSVYPMAGYTKGNTITYAAVKAEVKEHFTGSNMTIQGLYDEEAWDQLLAGENPTAANGIKVEHNGTTIIHVILKNATAANSNADTTNPQTGDYITIAVSTMVLAAVALVSVIELKKRQLI